MRMMTKRMFMAVIVAMLVSIVCFFMLLKDMERITANYNTLVNGYIENRKIMSEIGQNMYNIQAQVAIYTVNTDEGKYEYFENKIKKLDTQIHLLLSEFEARLVDDRERELFRQVMNSFNGYETQMQIALKFSREGAMKSAEYYVCTVMEEYLENTNDAFRGYYERTKKSVTLAKEDMEQDITRVERKRDVITIVICVVLAACIFIVYRSGRKIVNKELRESDENNQRIMDMQYKTIVGMANLIESRDGETGEHVRRTSAYAGMIAEELSKEEGYRKDITISYMENLWKAAPLHDIGKIIVSDMILQKPGRLTPEEFNAMKLHASKGGVIIDEALGAIEDKAYLDMAHDVARYHHEKWDGTGYPDGLRGEEIPLCARIMAVADVFDALISKRCYKDAMPLDKAFDIISESSGSHFDPKVAEVFLRIRPRVEEYLEKEDLGG